ncbi:MAG: alpha/beta hydrolase [Acidobacteriota bacterium]|nr:alpha/beta hydrolase [Acidobacteriota bacterium]
MGLRLSSALAVPLLLGLCLSASTLAAQTAPAGEAAYGPRLEGYAYPHPVQQYRFQSQGQSLEMAYMDVAAAHPNGQVAVLLHGKNFCAATWEPTIEELSRAGYRVIAPDQIGFCKSSKPQTYQFTFQQLAANTHALLGSLGISQYVLIGHSTGGMLAMRYGLMYPAEVKQLVLVDPIGLEDWKALGVPWQSVDEWYKRELATTAERIRNYEKNTYYAGTWSAGYEEPVQMLAGMYRGAGREQVAWDSALLYDMIQTQPVIYEIGQLQMPVLLMIGEKDNTAIGKDLAGPELRKKLGNYAELGRKTAALIPHATLVSFPDLGHAPQIQAPERFHKALLEGMAAARS